jgi:hypothetical protein
MICGHFKPFITHFWNTAVNSELMPAFFKAGKAILSIQQVINPHAKSYLAAVHKNM